MKNIKNILFILFFTSSISLFAQTQYSSTNTKAIKIFEKGVEFYNNKEDEKAIKEMNNAIDKDPKFSDPHYILANIYIERADYEKAIEEYKKGLSKNPTYQTRAYFELGLIEFHLGKYADGKDHLEKFMSFPSRDIKLADEAKRILASCKFAINSIANPIPFNPQNLGEGVNTSLDEYFPAITTDDKGLLFTRKIKSSQNNGGQEDFYYSIHQSGEWQQANNLGGPINSYANEGAPTMSSDGQILIFTACDYMGDRMYGPNREGYGSCDLFFSKKQGNNWSPPRNLGTSINSGIWETQPSFSSDGKTMYFIRGVHKGVRVQDADIYTSTLTDKGWSQPARLSNKINTPGNEESVLIHPDNQTLYFSSDGHIGMGKLDIYMSKRQPDGEWGEPVNLGYPLNTFNDEYSLLVNAQGNLAYFSSNREGGHGGLDIYSFELPEHLRPTAVTYMKGKVFDNGTKKPLEARFELIDLETGKLVIESYSNSGNGEFIVALPVNKNYALNASKSGYLFFSENFSLKENKSKKPTVKDVPLSPINIGEKTVLRNVFFATGSAELKPESKVELNKLINLLEKNPTVKIEISGHTDNVGDDNANQVLSENRAKSVMNYLVAGKIASERLTSKGYGETQPMPGADNDTEDGRALNRRTEFKITAK